jgi:penicillin-binding protein 1A
MILCAFLILGGAGIGGGFYYLVRDLPSIELLRSYEPSQATRIYGEDDQLIGQFFVEKRVFVPLSKLPKVLPQAIIAVEDARFYEHKGFSFEAILRAFVANLGSLRIRQGASTITQQLARSLFLSSERTLKRKIKELLLARKVEQVLSKDEILDIYLNQIYFGHGAYGVQIASRTYFGKDASELSLSEAAMLAGLPKAPNDYSPFTHPEKAKSRQAVVLKRMVEAGYISEAQYKEAYAQNIYLQRASKDEELAPYFLDQVRQYLVATYGDDTVYKGGLNVYTTLNVQMQRSANRAVREGLRELDKRQGYRGPSGKAEGEAKPGRIAALYRAGDFLDGEVTRVGSDAVWVDVGSGVGKIPLNEMAWAFRRLKGPDLRNDVRVIRNGKPSDILKAGDLIRVRVKGLSSDGIPEILSLEQEPQVEGAFVALDPTTGAIKAMVGGYDFKRSEFNRATLSRRQPGSAFKPIIYATAVEMGFSPSTMMLDSPIIYTDPQTQKVWKPENYESEFYGPISMRDALVHSRNVATVRLLEKIGVKSVIGFARRVGIQSALSSDLSLALGSSGVSLLELTSAISVFGNQGVRAEPRMIASIKDHNGVVLESHEVQQQQVISRETAYIVTSMMEDVIHKGTARAARGMGRPLAGKTGTTNDFTDAWFIGYAPNLAAGVWVGFDDLRSLGDREAGATVALPIWMGFMNEVFPVLPPASFPIPEDIVYAKIDPLSGQLAPADEEGAVVDIFVKGTEPKKTAVLSPPPVQFFKADEPNDQEE